MAVALVAHYTGPRLGIGQYIQRLLPPLIEELQEQKITFKVLASPNAFDKTPVLRELKDRVEIVKQLDYSPAKRYVWCATSLNRYCRQVEVDSLVWLSNPIILPWHPHSLAVIHDVNEWKDSEKYGNRLKTTLRSLIYLDASFIYARSLVSVSDATAKDIERFRPCSRIKDKLKTISNGADSQLLDLMPAQIKIPSNPFLLSVGRIDPAAKNLHKAVELVENLREQSQKPWELHLIGGMNATTQTAGEDFLMSVRDLPWVAYHGYASDAELAHWYRRANAVVFLSDNEGFGFPIAEAACFGRWAIISQNNQAGTELGGDAVIAISLQQIGEGASIILSRLKTQKFPNISTSMPSWKNAAVAYAKEISSLESLS